MPRIKLIIEYDGSAYGGWQKQINSKTIQGELERAIAIVCKEPVLVTGAGRTDSGVHARNQVAHCDVPEKTDLTKLLKSVNGLVNNDIVVKRIENCKADFHARYDAKSRIYKYYISKTPTAVNRNFAWYISYPLNVTLMQKAAQQIERINNFKSFCKAHSSNKTFECQVTKSSFFINNETLVYEIAANRFLYGMVRAIVGTLVQIGSGKIKPDDLISIAEAKDRSKVKMNAPAKGLILEQVDY